MILHYHALNSKLLKCNKYLFITYLILGLVLVNIFLIVFSIKPTRLSTFFLDNRDQFVQIIEIETVLL